MSSPIETPPVAGNTATSVEPSDLVIGGTRIPLPRWARFLIGILALVGTAVPIAVKVTGWPAPDIVSAGAEAKPTPPPTIPPPSTDQGHNPTDQGHKISEADMIDFRESGNHADEEPRENTLVLNSPELGTLRVKFFISDRCLQVIRKSPGPNPVTTSHYILATKMEDRSPGKVEHAWLLQDSAVDRDWLAAQMEAASMKAPVESAAPAPTGNCWNPHGGEFRWWNGEQRGCWLQVWRAWPDGCQHYQWFNTCNGSWDSMPNGAPQVYWTNCVH